MDILCTCSGRPMFYTSYILYLPWDRWPFVLCVTVSHISLFRYITSQLVNCRIMYGRYFNNEISYTTKKFTIPEVYFDQILCSWNYIEAMYEYLIIINQNVPVKVYGIYLPIQNERVHLLPDLEQVTNNIVLGWTSSARSQALIL